MKQWADCQRCDRRHGRLGVYAPSWPQGLKVVVLGTRASWCSQAVGADDARVDRIVRLLRQRLTLSETECIGDTLVACGAGDVLSPDHVAACSARHVENANRILPELVVFAGRRTEALAAAAGELSGQHWMPFGFPRGVTSLLADDELEPLVFRVAQLLGRKQLGPPPMRDDGFAEKLASLLGAHHGARSVPRFGKPTKLVGRVDKTSYGDHLVGRAIVTPVRTHGPWPYAVIIVGRESAVQHATFNDVVGAILALFPRSFILESAVSGEIHIYVRLPSRISYGHGALVLRAYLEHRGLRWRYYVGQLVDGVARAVLKEVAAAPAEPPPLPFGAGWSRRGSDSNVAGDILAFINWIRDSDTTDYEDADKIVRARFNVGLKWRDRDRSELRDWLLESELALEQGDDIEGELPQGWLGVTSCLSKSAQRIARAGVRGHGAFARRAALLIDELANLVDRDDVERLMLTWLSKPMVDEAITADPDTGREKVLREIARRFRPWRGVPTRFWNVIEARVRTQWSIDGAKLSARPERVTVERLLQTAFFISGKFYRPRTPSRRIHYTAFERFTLSNTAHAVRLFLTQAGILSVNDEYIEGVKSRSYNIAPDLWPPRASELRVFRL